MEASKNLNLSLNEQNYCHLHEKNIKKDKFEDFYKQVMEIALLTEKEQK